MQLSEWRRVQGLTQQQAADKIGTTQPTIAKCERGMIPRPVLMRLIISGTDGAVTANDFYAAHGGPSVRDDAA